MIKILLLFQLQNLKGKKYYVSDIDDNINKKIIEKNIYLLIMIQMKILKQIHLFQIKKYYI